MTPASNASKQRGPRLRRRLVLGGLVAVGGAAIVGASLMPSNGNYDAILAEQLKPLPDTAGPLDLVRFATLAANSHNTQPWLFRAGAASIDIVPDFSRRTPVVDPEDHHVFASLGCAAENLSLAAKSRGMSGDVLFDPAGDGKITVSLAPGFIAEAPLAAASPARQCSRSTYDGSAVETDILGRLDAAARVGGVEPLLVTDTAKRDGILDLVLAGNSRQLDDPAFRTELKSWLRFNPGAAAATRDGLLSIASGNPSLPGWLGPFMYDLTVSKDSDNKKVADQIRSSSGIAVFVPGTDDRAGWVAAGRAYQRFALQGTLDGLKHAFINQAVEVPDVRKQLQALLGTGDRRTSLIVRFGRGPEMPRALRRAVADVTTTA